MRFFNRSRNFLILFAWMIGLVGLFLLSLQIDQQVQIQDPNLEAAIREELGQPQKPLHASALSKITELDASGRDVISLEGIQALSNLSVLTLENNAVTDLSPLAELRKLRKLNLTNNSLLDLQAANLRVLSGIPLIELNLDYNVVVDQSGRRTYLTDLSVIKDLKTLKILTLTQNTISDLSPLVTMHELKTLLLTDNRVQDISPLRGLDKLKTLDLADNDVADLSPLSGLVNLTNLTLANNVNVQSIRPLASLASLKKLNLDRVQVGADLDLLAGKDNLDDLSLAGAQITDISPFKGLVNLEDLNLQDNDIVDLTPLSALVKLKQLDIQSNSRIVSIQPIQNLVRLEKLDIQNVLVGDQVSILSRLGHLVFLDVRNCGITDLAVLGPLMSSGALQDNSNSATFAFVDLRDNPISLTDSDGYASIRPYWQNISNRVPFLLPEFTPLAAPVFSASGGIYAQSFDLSLSSPVAGAQIYYTLDGSNPTVDSTRYTTPIEIRDRSTDANHYSEIKTTSPRFTPPVGKVSKATVVRARLIHTDGSLSPIITHSYFLNPEKKYTFPVISLVSDPINFFDPKSGIYVTGEIYEYYKEVYAHVNPWEIPANYTQHGDAWERPIHIEYFNVDGTLGFSQDASVRVHGAATRERGQKSLSIYTGCNGLCKDTVDFELFPGLTGTGTGQPITQFKTFLLRNSGNDWNSTMFRDAFIQSLIEHTNLDIQAYQPAIVFLNGEYWGIHNIRERLDEFYLKNHYGLDSAETVILTDTGTLSSGQPGDEQPYLDLIEFIQTHDMADSQNYAYIQTQMDIDNYIDYQIMQIYVNNTDWPQVNVKYWRKKTASYNPNAPYGQDGRWRWMIYDTDYGFGYDGGASTAAHNNILNAIHPDWSEGGGILFASLLENPEFKAAFITRFADHLNTSFTSERVLEKIDQMQAIVAPEIEEHILRWRGEESTLQYWQESVNVLRYFAQHRPQYQREHLIADFQLSGTAQICLKTDPAMGYIHINTVDIKVGTPGVSSPASWTGIYFIGMPIHLVAVPLPGYKFIGWEGAIDSPDPSITLTLTSDTNLQAIFVSDAEPSRIR